MNNMTIGKMLKIFIIIQAITLVFVLPSFAQNFTQLIPASASSDDILTEEEVGKILRDEGILNQTKKDAPFRDNIDDVMNDIEPLKKQVTAGNYSVGINDVIEVTVQRHPELSGEYTINNEGKIQYEFVGDVVVAGETKNDIVDILKKRLSKFIMAPEVNVKILEYNSKVVYVIGEVGRPGKIFMRGDTITVREALVQAGLPLLTAKSAKSSLITPSKNGNPKRINVNIQKLLYHGDLRENYVMHPGDTLYIPPTLMAKTMRVIQPIAAPIGTAAGTGRQVTTGF